MPPKTDMDLTPQCAAGVALKENIETLKQSDIDQWDAINQLQQRLPVWATLLMTVMGMILGATLTYASMVSKMGR